MGRRIAGLWLACEALWREVVPYSIPDNDRYEPSHDDRTTWRAHANEARKEAKIQLGRAAKGDDPAADKASARRGLSFVAFTERYLSDHATTKKKQSSVRMDRINLSKHILPIFGRKRLDAIGRIDVVRLHHSMRNVPGAANRCLALLSKIMNLAERWGERPDGSNPCRHVEKYRENKRSRFLSANEFARFGEVCQRCEQDGTIVPSFLALVRLCARLSEIQKARWDWVDFEAGTLRLPDSKTGAKRSCCPPQRWTCSPTSPRCPVTRTSSLVRKIVT